MHNKSDKIMRQIIASPWDDAPRKNFANTLLVQGNLVRADFITRHLALYSSLQRRPFQDPVNQNIAVEQITLTGIYNENIKQWLRDDGIASLGYDISYHRGFAEHLIISADDLFKDIDNIFSSAPICHLDITKLNEKNQHILESSYLKQIATLSLDGENINDSFFDFLINSGNIQHIEWLQIKENQISIEGFERIAANLKTLKHFDFWENTSTTPKDNIMVLDYGILDIEVNERGKQLSDKYGNIEWLNIPKNINFEKELFVERYSFKQ